MKMKKEALYNFFTNTFIRYLFSYLLILFVLISGFVTIIRSQLTGLYFQQLTLQSREKLDNIAQHFADEMASLNSISVAVKADMNTLQTENSRTKYLDYQIFTELNKFSTGKTLIDSIVYYNKRWNILVSPGILTAYTENGIRFLEDSSLVFDYSGLLNCASNQLVYLKGEDDSYLIFFPTNSVYDNHLLFFVVNQREMSQLCKNISSADLPAVAFVDSAKNIIAGYNTEMLLPHMDKYRTKDGLYPIDDHTSIRVCTDLTEGCMMLALVSNDLLLAQVDAVFRPIYKVLLVLTCVGFLLVLFSMCFTYRPLKVLTRKLKPDSRREHNHLSVLEQTFSEASQQNREMKEKLEKYQLTMKKSILNSILTENQPEGNHTPDNIDKFYSMEPDNHIFMITMQTPQAPIPYERIISLFRTVFTEDTPCIILEMTDRLVTFLLCYTGSVPEKWEKLHILLTDLSEKEGCCFAVSDSSSSPMDIPSMYESCKKISTLWEQNPVVFATDKEASGALENVMNYPYDTIGALTDALADADLETAGRRIDELYQIIDTSGHSADSMSCFFIRYILSDMLYTIINAMNDCNIRPDTYKNLYLETLYYCRSFPYQEKEEAIKINMSRLLEQLSESVRQKSDIDHQLRLLIEENYSNPDISISYIAEYFHISTAYASLLVKRSAGLNFSDYLWEFRLKKAKELLTTTQESVDSISIKVGYLNPSSFRRKFKQETGITPSAYREAGEYRRD